MSNLIKYTVRFILFILFQVYVLDKVHLHQMVTPYIYFLFILWLPFKMNREVASCCWHSCSVSRSTVSGITPAFMLRPVCW